jgi:hypothetical protein
MPEENRTWEENKPPEETKPTEIKPIETKPGETKPAQAKPNPPHIIQGKRPAPDTQSWREHMWKEKQQTPNRLEDVAKFLATMISISLSMFLAVGKTTLTDSEGPAKLSIALWLLSLIAAFLVLFPWRYKYSSVSVASMKEAHARIVRHKYWLLALSSVLFLAALSILARLYFFGVQTESTFVSDFILYADSSSSVASLILPGS